MVLSGKRALFGTMPGIMTYLSICQMTLEWSIGNGIIWEGCSFSNYTGKYDVFIVMANQVGGVYYLARIFF